MIKKLISVFIVTLFMFTSIGNASAAPKFKDVNDSYWANKELTYLANRSIIASNADGRFGINEEITRLEASDMIIKALGLNTDNRPVPHFKDVKPKDNGYAIIATIADEGIIQGNENGEFRPGDKLTRAQMAAILVRAFELKGTSSYAFRDVGSSHWASDAIRTLFANEITTGYLDNTYKPTASITRTQFAVFLARILNPEFKQSLACYTPTNTKQYIVNVAVTTLWKEPNKTRTVDRPAISKPVDMAKWTKEMTVKQKEWLVGKIESQALYGQEITILQSKGNWHQIAVKDQYTPKNKAGYPGWVPKSHITEMYPNYKDCQLAVVDAPTASLFNTTTVNDKFMDISFNTRLSVIKEEADWLHIQTPADGVKYLRKQDTELVANIVAIPNPTQKDILNTAKKFTGLPYLWAGISGFGFDCSGFTHTVYKHHGISIPRDSTVQAVQGKTVSKNELQPGDLMFFAYNKGKDQVHHVSIYIGNGQMIHSPNPRKSIEIISINAEPYKSEYSGARRYLK